MLVLEKLKDSVSRHQFQSTHRSLRGRPIMVDIYSSSRRRGDLKADVAVAELDMNDYDVTSLHVPYGPGWDVKKIEKLVYATVCLLSNRLVCLTEIW